MTTQFTNGYALLIGVDQNATSSLALPVVARDVAALQRVLQGTEVHQRLSQQHSMLRNEFLRVVQVMLLDESLLP